MRAKSWLAGDTNENISSYIFLAMYSNQAAVVMFDSWTIDLE
jgi:hypothetical protein